MNQLLRRRLAEVLCCLKGLIEALIEALADFGEGPGPLLQLISHPSRFPLLNCTLLTVVTVQHGRGRMDDRKWIAVHHRLVILQSISLFASLSEKNC